MICIFTIEHRSPLCISKAQCVHERIQGPGDNAFIVCFMTEFLQGQNALLLTTFLLFSVSTSFESFLFYQHNVCQICPSSDFQHLLSKPGIEDTFSSCSSFNRLRCCFQNASYRYTGKEYQAHLMISTVDMQGGPVCQPCMYHPWTRYFNHFLSFSSPLVSCLYNNTFLKLEVFTFPSYVFLCPLTFCLRKSSLSMVFMALRVWLYLSVLCSAIVLHFFTDHPTFQPPGLSNRFQEYAYIYVSSWL